MKLLVGLQILSHAELNMSGADWCQQLTMGLFGCASDRLTKS